MNALRRLQAVIRRRLADFLDLDGAGNAAALAHAEQRIDDLRARLGAALAMRRRIERDAQAFDERTLSMKAERAIALGRDDLARAAMQEKAELNRRAAANALEIEALDAEAASIETSLAALAGVAPRLAAKLAELDALIETHETRNEG